MLNVSTNLPLNCVSQPKALAKIITWLSLQTLLSIKWQDDWRSVGLLGYTLEKEEWQLEGDKFTTLNELNCHDRVNLISSE
jgi:hypothetical protein